MQDFVQKIQAMISGGAFSFVQELTKEFPSAEVFLVGGVVRDAILGRESKDFDFVVRGVPLDALQEFLSKQGRVDLVGKTFGVLKFMPKDWQFEPIDIALPRTEHAFRTGGYKDVDVQFDPNLAIEKDLSRRDFTINALAWNVKSVALVDPFNGMADIQAKVMRTVGNSAERFKEDYSRMLRAMRFACELGFDIEKEIWQALAEHISHINDTKDDDFIFPRETVAKELIKAFVSNPYRAFELYEQSKAFDVLMPELLKMKGCPHPENFHSEGDVWTHTKLCMKNLTSDEFTKRFNNESPSAELVFAVLFHDSGKPYTIKTPEADGVERIQYYDHDNVGGELIMQVCHRLKLSSLAADDRRLHVDCDRLVWLVKKHMLPSHSVADEMRDTTVEKYFFNRSVPGDDLLKLIWVDMSATIPKDAPPDFSNLEKLEGRVEKLRKLGKTKKELPKDILSGTEIMERFKLTPGPKIGALKEALREEQLAGRVQDKDQAWKFLETIAKQ